MQTTPWNRAIILVDMNAFFASIEQKDNPSLRGKPIAVTNGEQGSCIITSSYEARSYGVKTGMRLREAKKLCPQLIRCPSRVQRYTEVSTTIMQRLKDLVPDLEIFSVDEAFLDVTHYQKLYGSPAKIGLMLKEAIFDCSGLLCSVGVSGDKTTAKYAAKLNKPDGYMVIPPWQAKQRLHDVPITDLCGIANGIGNFLARYGVYKCGDMQKLPISILGQRFGNIGRRIWYMCQGADPEPVKLTVAPPKSMGHGKVMPPNTADLNVILAYLLHMSEKLAARLRRNDLEAQIFYIGLREQYGGWLARKEQSLAPTNDGKAIYALAEKFVQMDWLGQAVCQVQITALDPRPAKKQLDLFGEFDPKREYLNSAVDTINSKYGEFVIAPARLLNRSAMHNVIAPAWKPDGPRKSV